MLKASREIHHNWWWLWLLFLPLLMLVQHQRPVLAAESDTVLQRSSKTTPPEVNINGPYKFGIATGYELFATEEISTNPALTVNTVATPTLKAENAPRILHTGLIAKSLTTKWNLNTSRSYSVGKNAKIITHNDTKVVVGNPSNASELSDDWAIERGLSYAPIFDIYNFNINSNYSEVIEKNIYKKWQITTGILIH